MPELPEVETTKRGISPYLLDKTIAGITLRQTRLRLPVDENLHSLCVGQQILSLSRRGKYLILHLSQGALLIHLGMSGHLRLSDSQTPLKKHDHIDLVLTDGNIIRYNDPRRFGVWLYCQQIEDHPLLAHLGPEPLLEQFNGDYLFLKSRQKRQAVKSFIMNNQTVVGVGNIYATESLFLAGIHPQQATGLLTQSQCDTLACTIKSVLQNAIDQGGTTLRDFFAANGKPGYFALSLNVYGRQGFNCIHCQTVIESVVIAGRHSAFCPNCQPRQTP